MLLGANYFAYFASLGVLLPFWAPYLAHLGFGPREIGEIVAVLMATRIVVPPLTGWLADRTGREATVVRISSLGSAVIFGAVFWGRSYWFLVVVSALFGATWSSTLPPLESLTLRALSENTHRYGLVRLWGSVGFIAAVLGVGAAVDLWGLGIVLWCCLGILVLAAGLTLGLPQSAVAAPVADSPSFSQIVLRPAVLALLAVALLMQMSHGPYYTFFSLFVAAAGYGPRVVGVLWAVGVVAEVGMFVWLARNPFRARLHRQLLVSAALTTVRWLLIGAGVASPTLLVLAQLLHAASYALFHATILQYLFELFPGSLSARGQALYASVSYGMGGALGSFLAGRTWSWLGEAETFYAAAVLPLVCLCVVAATRSLRRSGAPRLA
jgi:MFS transporter, PPP family, 3-phenylpropionic acid transporter